MFKKSSSRSLLLLSLQSLNNNYLIIILIWGILTLLNLNKAFHIDDTFHLEAAKHLQENPLQPMSGEINWGNEPTPMHKHNQPPFFFYLIALVSNFLGISEIPLHLLISIFSLLALIFYYKLVQLFSIKKQKIFLLLFGLSPAFTVNQNLMTDIPLLSLVIASAYYLIKANQSAKLKYYILSAAFIAIGLLIKYTFLPILVVFALTLFISKRARGTLLIPLVTLVIWSVWNYYEFGRLHIASRSAGIIPERILGFPGCLGAIAFFSIPAFLMKYKRKFAIPVSIALISSFAFFVLAFIIDLLPQKTITQGINTVFSFNGLLFCFMIADIFFSENKLKGIFKRKPTNNLIVFLHIISISVFVSLFAPFMATRHMLLILPFLLIYLSDYLSIASNKIINSVTIFTVLAGLLLGVSDWLYADYYRQEAQRLSIPDNITTWTVGHWGWQWYSTRNGLTYYHYNKSEATNGDFFIFPGNIARPKIEEEINLEVIDSIFIKPKILSMISVSNFASMYCSDYKKPAWTLSRQNIDTLFISRINMIDT